MMAKLPGQALVTVVLQKNPTGVMSPDAAFHAYCDMHFTKIMALATDGFFEMTQGSFVAHFDEFGHYAKCEKHLFLTHPKT